jgi:hypothetical protein
MRPITVKLLDQFGRPIQWKLAYDKRRPASWNLEDHNGYMRLFVGDWRQAVKRTKLCAENHGLALLSELS